MAKYVEDLLLGTGLLHDHSPEYDGRYLNESENLSDVQDRQTSLDNLTDASSGSSGQVLTTDGTNASWQSVSGSGITDSDKGDITVSSSGSVWTIDNDVVNFAKMQTIATDRILGRATASTGDIEELTAAQVRAIINFDTEVSNNTDVAANTTARHNAVTLAGTPDYLTLSSQEITLNPIDLTTDVSGDLPITEGGTGASTASGARTNLGLDAGGSGDIWVEKSGDDMTGALTNTIDDTDNYKAITVTNNDETNKPTSVDIVHNITGGDAVNLYSNTARTTGVLININDDNASSSATVASIKSDGDGDALNINATKAGAKAINVASGQADLGNDVLVTGGSISGITDLAIADGGTGQSTQQGALDAITDASSGTNGQVLTTDGTNASWQDAAAGYTDEQAQDAVGTILTDTSEINFTYDDVAPAISAAIVAGSIDETKLDTSVNASLDLADTATQPGDLATVATSGDHTDLSNIGTNTHAQIDSHIADSSIHFTQAAISIPASQITDFDTEVSNNTDVAANTSARHDAVTLDTTSHDYLSLTGQEIALSAIDLTTDVSGVLPDANVANDITLTNITQVTNRSHTDLTDIGTNSHAQIDTHIASTSNPHSVTADQVLPTQTGNSGKFLTTDGTNSSWGTPSASVSNLDDIGDVTITSPADNELLAYDTGTSEWINQTKTEAGFGTLSEQDTVNNSDWSGTDLSIANGGTGQSTQQAALDAITDASSGTNGQVLTTDGTNASWEDASDVSFKTIYNNSGGTINPGDLLRINGSFGSVAAVVVADKSTCSCVDGIATETIAFTATGKMQVKGTIQESYINTNGFTAGNVAYLNTSGGFTDTKPTTGFIVPIGKIGVVAPSGGSLVLNLPHYAIETSSPQSSEGDLLVYSSNSNQLRALSVGFNGRVLTADSTDPSGFGMAWKEPATPGYELVEEKNISSFAITSTTFSGLSGNDNYFLDCTLVNKTVSNVIYELRINGDSNSLDYVDQTIVASGPAVTPSRTLNQSIFAFTTAAADVCYSCSDIALSDGHLIHNDVCTYAITATDTPALFYTGGYKNSSVASISSITVVANVSSGIGVGSKLALYRKAA